MLVARDGETREPFRLDAAKTNRTVVACAERVGCGVDHFSDRRVRRVGFAAAHRDRNGCQRKCSAHRKSAIVRRAALRLLERRRKKSRWPHHRRETRETPVLFHDRAELIRSFGVFRCVVVSARVAANGSRLFARKTRREHDPHDALFTCAQRDRLRGPPRPSWRIARRAKTFREKTRVRWTLRSIFAKEPRDDIGKSARRVRRDFPERGGSSSKTFASAAVASRAPNARDAAHAFVENTSERKQIRLRASTSRCASACSGDMYAQLPTIMPVRVTAFASRVRRATPKSTTRTFVSPSPRSNSRASRRDATRRLRARTRARRPRARRARSPRRSRADLCANAQRETFLRATPSPRTADLARRRARCNDDDRRMRERTQDFRFAFETVALVDAAEVNTFSATVRPVALSCARYTRPIPPTPASRSMRNRPATGGRSANCEHRNSIPSRISGKAGP